MPSPNSPGADVRTQGPRAQDLPTLLSPSSLGLPVPDVLASHLGSWPPAWFCQETLSPNCSSSDSASWRSPPGACRGWFCSFPHRSLSKASLLLLVSSEACPLCKGRQICRMEAKGCCRMERTRRLLLSSQKKLCLLLQTSVQGPELTLPLTSTHRLAQDVHFRRDAQSPWPDSNRYRTAPSRARGRRGP